MEGLSELLKEIYLFRIKNNLTYAETGKIIEEIAVHHQWYGGVKMNEQVNESLKEDSNAM